MQNIAVIKSRRRFFYGPPSPEPPDDPIRPYESLMIHPPKIPIRGGRFIEIGPPKYERPRVPGSIAVQPIITRNRTSPEQLPPARFSWWNEHLYRAPIVGDRTVPGLAFSSQDRSVIPDMIGSSGLMVIGGEAIFNGIYDGALLGRTKVGVTLRGGIKIEKTIKGRLYHLP